MKLLQPPSQMHIRQKAIKKLQKNIYMLSIPNMAAKIG